MNDIINKSNLNWNFTENDWFVGLALDEPNIRYRLFTLKNYSLAKVNDIIFEIYTRIQEYRTKLELETESFINKKAYLAINDNNSKTQITLEEEYILKGLVEKYKIYELIGWFHVGKNAKIFKYTILKKQEILEQIYPIVDLSIRKVIGSKVISPYKPEFEEAVNNAWMAIIKYLTKIDTSKVMFSIFVGIAHRSAIYYNAVYLKNQYNVICISDLEISSENESEDMNEDVFINKILNNQNINETNASDEFFDEIEENYTKDMQDEIYIEQMNDYFDDNIYRLENNNEKTTYLQQNVLAYSYEILSGKIKRICLEKIFAEFFNDLINSKITEKTITKHTPILIEIMNLVELNPALAQDASINNNLYKLFKDWLKEKIDTKLAKYNMSMDGKNSEGKQLQILELVKRENNMLIFLKEHKNEMIDKLLEFKNSCVNFKS